MGMFILSILIILMSAFKVDPEYRFVKRLGKSFLIPMVKFLAINCCMAFVLSLFMGEGNTGVTGSSSPTISLGDPVMVMLAMLILNGIVLFLFCKLLLGVWKDIKSAGKLVGNFLAGVVGSVGGLAVATAVGNAGRKIKSKFTGGNEGESGLSSGGTSKSPSGSEGGGANPRAKKRGNSVTYVERNGDREIRKTAYTKKGVKRLEKEYKKRTIRNSTSSSTIDYKISSGLGILKKSKDKETGKNGTPKKPKDRK